MSCPIRIYPLRKPENHRQPIPRWTLSLPEGDDRGHNHVYTTYIGVQQHSCTDEADEASKQAIRVIQEWLAKDGPPTFESFTGIALDDSESKDVAVWVCYWSVGLQHATSMRDFKLSSIHSALPAPGRASIGLWKEGFTTDVSRLETNYSGLDYLPGLAKLPGASTKEHNLSAYWGAARDRIPDSAFDLFPKDTADKPQYTVPHGFGQHLVGTGSPNMVHIRSGQWWENCGQQEADAYEKKLEPTLRAGLQYLREGDDTGAISIRYLRNEDLPARSDGRERKETCGAGFFSNLADLEKWAHTHPSHLKIYRGALSHYKEFGDLRRFRTWHEVSVLHSGSAEFEYVNCAPKTGSISSIRLEIQDCTEQKCGGKCMLEQSI